jgi:uncharacterized RDD family membrane protein YckC
MSTDATTTPAGGSAFQDATLGQRVGGFPCYLVGFFVALASKKNQRLGDMAASTRVVRAK